MARNSIIKSKASPRTQPGPNAAGQNGGEKSAIGTFSAHRQINTISDFSAAKAPEPDTKRALPSIPKASAQASVQLKDPLYHFCLKHGAKRVYIWTYLVQVKSHIELSIELCHRELAISDAERNDRVPWQNRSHIGLWGLSPTLSPQSPIFEHRAGIAFDSQQGKLQGFILGRISGQKHLDKFPFNECEFDASIFPNQPEINLSSFGEKGRLSSEGAAALTIYLEAVQISAHRFGKFIIRFDQAPGISPSETILINLFLLYISRHNNKKERQFSLNEIMPAGFRADLETIDHYIYMSGRPDQDFSQGGSVTVILEVTKAVVTRRAGELVISGLSDNMMQQFQQAIPYVTAAIARGVDVPRALSELPLAHDASASAEPSSQLVVTKPPLPEKARILYADRAKDPALAGLNIIEFLRAEYGPWLDGRLTRSHLKMLDSSAYKGIANWLLTKPFPDGFYLPTRKESNDDLITALGLGQTLAASPALAKVIDNRLRRGKRIPGM